MSLYIFGYGSLINMTNNTEIDNPSERCIYPVIVEHMERSWNVCGKSQRYLGVKNRKHYKTNGILFKISEEELKKIIKRETYYEPKQIPNHRIQAYDKSIRITSNDVIICFYPIITYHICKPIKLSYLYMCLKGCLKISKSFTKDFIEMTTMDD